MLPVDPALRDTVSPMLRGGLGLDTVAETRDELLAIAAEVESAGSWYWPVRDLVARHLAEVRNVGSSSEIYLAVAGSEGAGKSTLINGLVGDNVTPTDPHRATTVAPVFIMNALSTLPVFEVEFESGDQVQCADSDEFFQYLAQQHNPRNEKQVRRGVVRIQNDVLAAGLVVIDLPGTEGIEQEAARTSLEFARGHVPILIGVERSRSYGPLARTLSSFARHGRVPVAAVVANVPLDPFMGETGQSTYMRRHREAVGEGIALAASKYGIEVVLPRDGTFALHLPTLLPTSIPVPSRVSSPVHEVEIARFERYFSSYLVAYGVDILMSEMVLLIQAALGEIDDFLVDRERTLGVNVASYSPDRLRSEMSDARVSQSKLWTQQMAELVPRLTDQILQEVGPELDQLKSDLSDKVDADRAYVRGLSKVDEQQALDVLEQLKAFSQDRQDRFEDRLAAVLEPRFVDIIAAGNSLVDEYVKAFPADIGEEIAHEAVRGTGSRLRVPGLVGNQSLTRAKKAGRTALGSASLGGVAYYFSAPATVASLVGGALLTGGALIGATGLGFASTYALSRFRGGRKGQLLATLTVVEQMVSELYAGEGLREEISQHLLGHVASVDRDRNAIMDHIDRLVDGATDSTERRSRLIAEVSSQRLWVERVLIRLDQYIDQSALRIVSP